MYHIPSLLYPDYTVYERLFIDCYTGKNLGRPVAWQSETLTAGHLIY